MFYQFVLFALFLVLAGIHRPHRFEWGVLSCLLFSTWVNTIVYGVDDSELYVIRSTMTMFAALVLIWRCTNLAIYQAIVLIITLLAYGALAYDVSQGQHILIYNNYEAAIYGIVACQLFGIYPTLRDCYSDHLTSGVSMLERLQRGSLS